MNTGHSFTTAQLMEESFNLIGCSMMKDDFAAQLLAFTYVCGGEVVVLHTGLNAGIAIASQKFKIKGGEVPDANGVRLINQYIKELEDKGPYTPWLKDIYTRYEIPEKMQPPASMFNKYGKGTSVVNPNKST